MNFSNLSNPLFLTIITLLFSISTKAQFGGEISYVYGPKKEAFAGRIFTGEEFGLVRLGLGYENGKFIGQNTNRELSYYEFKLGIDYNFFVFESPIVPYLGMDFDFLKTTKIVDESRVSIFPKAGLRLFNILFLEFTPDDISEPNDAGRFFKFNYNSYRLLLGFHYYFDAT